MISCHLGDMMAEQVSASPESQSSQSGTASVPTTRSQDNSKEPITGQTDE